jgi:hypothetical protein
MLTAEQEKFVVDLFLIHQKQQQVNAFSEQRQIAEKALATQYEVDKVNNLRAKLVEDFNANTSILKAEINDIQKNLTK